MTWSSSNAAVATVYNTGFGDRRVAGRGHDHRDERREDGNGRDRGHVSSRREHRGRAHERHRHRWADLAAHRDSQGRERQRDLGCARHLDRRQTRRGDRRVHRTRGRASRGHRHRYGDERLRARRRAGYRHAAARECRGRVAEHGGAARHTAATAHRTVTDASGNTIPGQTITWESSNSLVAAVGTTGLVIAIAPGTATIPRPAARVHGTAGVTVSLVPARRVTLTPDALSFTQGDQGTQLAVALLDSAGGALDQSGRTIAWSSNKTGVASVNGSGFVTPGGPGQAVITATLVGTGLSATATVTVTPVPVASVSVTPAPERSSSGNSCSSQPPRSDADGNPLSGRAITWDGSDDNVATVSSNGRVTALSAGTMTVSATSEGKTGTATIVVNAVPVASVVLSPTTQSVVVGQNTTAFTAVTKAANGNVLNGRKVTFSSDNTAVATIDAATGVATGVSAGTAQITATSEGITSNAATLTVNLPPVGSVTVDPPSQTITDGGTAAFSAALEDAQHHPLTGRTVTWDSSDHSVATIDNTGLATSTGPGTSTITATSEGKKGMASLQVDPAPVTSVVVTPPFDTTNVGSTVQLAASIQGGDAGHRPPVTWSSADNGIAMVDDHGRVRGVGPGDVAITATAQGKSGSALVTVLP